MSDEGARWVALGRIKGAFGVRGEVRVVPYAQEIARLLPDASPPVRFPLNRLLEYPLWRLGREAPGTREISWNAGRMVGEEIRVSLQGITTREEVQALAGEQIWLPQQALPELPRNHYYWTWLQGLRVLDVTEPASEPMKLGYVTGIFATGSNDVLVVQEEEDGEERLLPFIHDTVLRVDLLAGEVIIQRMPGL